MNQMDLMSGILDYEMGILEFDDTIELFEELYQTGMLWQLQGAYQRAFMDLVEAGHIVVPGGVSRG